MVLNMEYYMTSDRYGVHFPLNPTYQDNISVREQMGRLSSCSVLAAQYYNCEVDDLNMHFELDWSDCYYAGDSPSTQVTFTKRKK